MNVSHSNNLHESLVSTLRIQTAQSLGGMVLDCGGGLGAYLPYFTAHRVIVLDIALEPLSRLRHPYKVCSDACVLPFKDAVFDGVWACAVAQNLPVPIGELIKEIRRVTKPGGKILILVPNGSSIWDKLKRIVGMQTWKDLSGVRWLYSPSDLSPYGKVVGEVRFLPGERCLRRFPRLCHTLLLEINN